MVCRFASSASLRKLALAVLRTCPLATARSIGTPFTSPHQLPRLRSAQSWYLVWCSFSAYRALSPLPSVASPALSCLAHRSAATAPSLRSVGRAVVSPFGRHSPRASVAAFAAVRTRYSFTSLRSVLPSAARPFPPAR